MAGWGETARGLVKPIPEMADDLKEDLIELSDVDAIHFEELVKVKGPRGYTPKCVDCMARHGGHMYLIEFRPLPGRGGEDIPGSLASKAVESAHIYGRFLTGERGPGPSVRARDTGPPRRDSRDVPTQRRKRRGRGPPQILQTRRGRQHHVLRHGGDVRLR